MRVCNNILNLRYRIHFKDLLSLIRYLSMLIILTKGLKFDRTVKLVPSDQVRLAPDGGPRFTRYNL